jgi:transposase
MTLGPERCAAIEAISVDLHDGWMSAIRAHCPRAAICADPFHVIKLASGAPHELGREMWQALRRTDPERASFGQRHPVCHPPLRGKVASVGSHDPR